jgi:hypothetical protein
MSSVTRSPAAGDSPVTEKQAFMQKAQASDFLTAHAPERKSARLSSAMLDYKRPDGLNMVPLGTSWAMDVFVRVHNGVRRECIDLYNMIDSMQRRIQDLRSADLKLFFQWWDTFVSYLGASLTLDDKLLVPWALSAAGAQLPKEVSEEVRIAGRNSMKVMKNCFDLVVDQLSRRPPDESLAKIIKGLTHIHPIFQVIEAIESKLPEIVEGKFSSRQGLAMERKVAYFMHKNGDGELRRFHLAIMSRGMTDEVQSAWRRHVPIVLRFSSSTHKTKYETVHLRVVDRLALMD